MDRQLARSRRPQPDFPADLRELVGPPRIGAWGRALAESRPLRANIFGRALGESVRSPERMGWPPWPRPSRSLRGDRSAATVYRPLDSIDRKRPAPRLLVGSVSSRDWRTARKNRLAGDNLRDWPFSAGQRLRRAKRSNGNPSVDPFGQCLSIHQQSGLGPRLSDRSTSTFGCCDLESNAESERRTAQEIESL